MTRRQYRKEVEKAYRKHFSDEKLMGITHDTLQSLVSTLIMQLQSPRRDHQFVTWVSMLDATRKAIVVKIACETVLPYI